MKGLGRPRGAPLLEVEGIGEVHPILAEAELGAVTAEDVAAGRIEQEHLRKLAAARVAREDEIRAARPPRYLAQWLSVERDLVPRTAGHVHAVQVADIPEAGRDEQAVAIVGPRAHAG